MQDCSWGADNQAPTRCQPYVMHDVIGRTPTTMRANRHSSRSCSRPCACCSTPARPNPYLCAQACGDPRPRAGDGVLCMPTLLHRGAGGQRVPPGPGMPLLSTHTCPSAADRLIHAHVCTVQARVLFFPVRPLYEDDEGQSEDGATMTRRRCTPPSSSATSPRTEKAAVRKMHMYRERLRHV